MKIDLSKEQLTVVLLVAGLVASAAFVSPAMVFNENSGTSDAKTGETYYTSTETVQQGAGSGTNGGPGTFNDANMLAVPDGYTETTTSAASDPPKVRASAGAQTMSVAVTQQDGEVALRLSDDRVHSGRWVSMPKSWFVDELGEVPTVAYVNHESGEEYKTSLYTRGNSVAFYVEEFSTNVVTFSGEVSVTGEFGDGGSAQWPLSNYDSASDVMLNLTGVNNSENESASASGLADGETLNLGVATDTTATVTLTGNSENHGTATHSYNWENPPTGETHTIDIDGTSDVEVELGAYEDGTDGSSTTVTLYIDGSQVGQTSIADGDYKRWYKTLSPGEHTIRYEADTSDLWKTNAAWSDTIITQNPSLDVDGDGSADVSYSGALADGETVTQSVDIPAGTDNATVSTDEHTVDVEANWTETTVTSDVGAELNTKTKTHSGTLAAGETTSLTFNQSVLKEGTNQLNISLGDGSLSADAPAQLVQVNLSHDAVDQHAVDYAGGQWTESYNVTETYASSRSSASLTIPFQADVYSIQNIEASINDSTWTSVATRSYSLDNTELTVNLTGVYGGTIPEGTTMDVRTTGNAVRASNATITVTEPTTPGQPLNSTVSIDAWDPDASIDVSGTPRGDRLHYTSSETWNATESIRWTGDGDQVLYMESASAGDQFRVQTLPLRIEPKSGDVRTRVPDDRVNRSQPVYRVTPGDTVGDSYDVTFTNASDGKSYILWSETNEVVVDSGTASSPLTLSDEEDNVALMQFRLDPGLGGDGSSSSSGGGGGAPIPMPTTGGDTNFIPLIGVFVLGAGVLVAARNDGAVESAGETAATRIESGLEGIPVLGPLLGKTIGGGIQTFTQLVEGIAGNRTVALAIVAALGIGAVQGGIIEVPQSSLTLIVVAGIAIFSLVALREFDEFTTERWAAILTATTIVTLQTLSDESLLTAIVESRVWPILAMAGVYLAYKLIQGIRGGPKEPPTNIVINGDTQQSDDGGDSQ